MMKPKKSVKEVLPHSDIAKILGLNVKMIQRYDAGQSVSDRNRGIIEEFINKYQTNTQYRAKIDLILNNSRKEASGEQSVIMTTIPQITGSLVHAVVALNHEVNELYQIVNQLVEHVIKQNDAIQANSEEQIPYELKTIQSTMARIDMDMKKVEAELRVIKDAKPVIVHSTDSKLPNLNQIKLESEYEAFDMDDPIL